MPPKSRKRSRAGAAQNAAESSTVADTTTDAPAARPRGRPRKDVQEPEPEPDWETVEESRPKRRGRKARQEVEPNPVPELEVEAETETRRKNKARKPKTRPSRPEHEVVPEEEEEEEVAESSTARRGVKRRQLVVEETEEQPAGPSQRKHKRQARQETTVDEHDADEDPVDRFRDRLEDDLEDPEFTEKTVANTKRKRSRVSNDVNTSTISTSSRQHASPSPVEDPIPGTKALSDHIASSIPHLAPRLRHIPHTTISTKWSPLAASSRETVSSLLHLAAQPALSRTGTNEARHRAGALAVRAVSKRIISKLSRGLPFPAASIGGVPSGPRGRSRSKKDTDGGRADELDFEKVVGGVRSLEMGLDGFLHAVALLEREKGRLIAQVEKEQKAVVEMEVAVKREAGMWKESLKKAHTLLPAETLGEGELRFGKFKKVADEEIPGSAFRGVAHVEDGDEKGEEVRDLARQVANHMESIKGNMAQIEGVVPQIGKTRAALQAVLGKALAEQVVANVLLG